MTTVSITSGLAVVQPPVAQIVNYGLLALIDTMIAPASSFPLSVGKDVKVWVRLHRDLASRPSSLRAIAAALAKPVKVKSLR